MSSLKLGINFHQEAQKSLFHAGFWMSIKFGLRMMRKAAQEMTGKSFQENIGDENTPWRTGFSEGSNFISKIC